MNKIPEAPYYLNSEIGSVKALGRALSLPPEHLEQLALKANQLYRKAKPIKKADGTIRQPFDAMGPLKEFHVRLKHRILSKVHFPEYLTGSIKGRDYVLNAKIHVGAAIVICEDITNFFPSVTSDIIFDVWRYLFGFPDKVATLLTVLTTKDGALPQGAIPSSYLANLALWRREPAVQHQLAIEDVKYSRYVDDIAVSSLTPLSKDSQTQIIAKIYGMLSGFGLKAKRKKHETHTSGNRMTTTKLVVNKKVALPAAIRSKIRSEVFRVEELSRDGILGEESRKMLASVSVKVGQMARHHPTPAKALKERLKLVRQAQHRMCQEIELQIQPESVGKLSFDADDSRPPPWD